MTYNLSAITTFLAPRTKGEHDWDEFVNQLESAGMTGIWMPQIGRAFFVDRGTTTDYDYNSFGPDQGSFFIFRVKDWNTERFFRVVSETSSFGGVYHGDLEEVNAVETVTTTWEPV